ncbi:MAG: tol-pal system-associated acyl-CoA thioesterase [Alphaproteobacteria bacterium]
MSALSGRVESGTHRLPIRVYYEDTDAVGIVYYANYLKFAERARTEMLRLAGINQSEMAKRYGMAFAVRDCAIDFRAPARLDDLIEVRSRFTELVGATVSVVQAIWRDAEELVRLDVRVACLRENGRPTRIPVPLRQALHLFIQPREQD